MVLGETIAVLQNVSGAVPVLVTVTMLAALVVPGAKVAKLMLPGETPATGAVPVPDRDALCVPPPLLALSVTVSVMVWIPDAEAA